MTDLREDIREGSASIDGEPQGSRLDPHAKVQQQPCVERSELNLWLPNKQQNGAFEATLADA